MSVEVSAPARASVSTTLNPRANEAREQIFSTQLMDWMLRGWVYSFGLLSDDTDIATVTTLADTTPTISLQSPTGGDTIVIPLRVWVSLTDDGGGLSTVDLVITQSALGCLTDLTLGGTALTGKINHLSQYPQVAPKSTLLHTVTASALTVVESVVIAHHHWADSALTTSLVVPNLDYAFNVPVGLMNGAALLIYGYTASTAGKIRPSIMWAEIPADKYLP